MAADDRVEVARWYTAGRRFPRLMGRLSDGTRIPGGPYTIQQLGVFVGGLLVLNLTRGLWGVFGTLINYALLFGLPWLAAKALGLFAWGRNPVTLAAGFLQLVTTPRVGRVNGHATVLAKPSGARAAAAGQAFIVAPESASVSARRRGRHQAVEVIAPVEIPGEPALSDSGRRPALSPVPLTGVQQLLAGRNDR